MRAQHAPPSPLVNGADGHIVARGHFIGHQKSLCAQTRAPIGEMIVMAKPADAHACPRRWHYGAHASLVEKIGDLFIGVDIDKEITDLLNERGVRTVEPT